MPAGHEVSKSERPSRPPTAASFVDALREAAERDGAGWENTWEKHAELIRSRCAAALTRVGLPRSATVAVQVHILDLTQGGHPIACAAGPDAVIANTASANLITSPDDPELAWSLASQCCPPAAYFNFHRQLDEIRKSWLAARVRSGQPLSNLPRFLREHIVSFLYKGARILNHMDGKDLYSCMYPHPSRILRLGRAGKFVCTGRNDRYLSTNERTDAGCPLLAAIGVSDHNKGSALCAAFTNSLCLLAGVSKSIHVKFAVSVVKQELCGAGDFYAEAGY